MSLYYVLNLVVIFLKSVPLPCVILQTVCKHAENDFHKNSFWGERFFPLTQFNKSAYLKEIVFFRREIVFVSFSKTIPKILTKKNPVFVSLLQKIANKLSGYGLLSQIN